jgi:hypothetical protein
MKCCDINLRCCTEKCFAYCNTQWTVIIQPPVTPDHINTLNFYYEKKKSKIRSHIINRAEFC